MRPTNAGKKVSLFFKNSFRILLLCPLLHAPLHIAYPFMGLAFLIVPVLAWALLGEPLTWQTLTGGALILAGVALASTGGKG